MPIKGTFTGAADVAIDTLIDVQVRDMTPLASTRASPSPSPVCQARRCLIAIDIAVNLPIDGL